MVLLPLALFPPRTARDLFFIKAARSCRLLRSLFAAARERPPCADADLLARASSPLVREATKVGRRSRRPNGYQKRQPSFTSVATSTELKTGTGCRPGRASGQTVPAKRVPLRRQYRHPRSRRLHSRVLHVTRPPATVQHDTHTHARARKVLRHLRLYGLSSLSTPLNVVRQHAGTQVPLNFNPGNKAHARSDRYLDVASLLGGCHALPKAALCEWRRCLLLAVRPPRDKAGRENSKG